MADKTVLLAEDDASIRLVVNQTLVSAGYEVRAPQIEMLRAVARAFNEGATLLVEAGTGSGAMTLALAQMVQPNGKVYTYEERAEHQENAKKNIARAKLTPYVEFRERDIRAGFDEKNADALFLDVREPWLFLAQAHAAIRPGGFFGSLVPTTNQVSDMLAEMERMSNWVEIEVSELLHRKYKLNAERLRPDDRMIAHTGFIITARPVAMHVEPVRTKREQKFWQKQRMNDKRQAKEEERMKDEG